MGKGEKQIFKHYSVQLHLSSDCFAKGLDYTPKLLFKYWTGLSLNKLQLWFTQKAARPHFVGNLYIKINLPTDADCIYICICFSGCNYRSAYINIFVLCAYFMYIFPIPIHMHAHIYQIIHAYVGYLYINNSGHRNSKYFSPVLRMLYHSEWIF